MNSTQERVDAATYRLETCETIHSPGLLIFRHCLRHNLDEMVRIAGSAERLRPHCKTHKTREIIQMQVELGIVRHKCATLREAEMLADLGVQDVLLAYQLVGPNIDSWLQLIDRFPNTRFASLIDDPQALEWLGNAASAAGQTVGVFMDVDSGMHRTGIATNEQAIQLYEMICTTPGIESRGLHWYDGHHRQTDLSDRFNAVSTAWAPFTQLRNQIMMSGLPVESVVAAGTGSFSILADLGEPNLELSPGTTTYFDIGYRKTFPDLNLKPALGILTRVVSKRRPGHLTLDVGHKSCAADPPAGSRLFFPEIPDAIEVKQTEEHLVIECASADSFDLGQPIVALPIHACPTSAVHDFATVIENGKVVDHWMIASRGRALQGAT